jgi:CDP-diacylglycerol pyrophosphatase
VNKLLKQGSNAFASIAVLLLALLLHGPASAINRSDILLDLVTHCVDPHQANYCSLCRAPRVDATCAPTVDCKKSTDVWALTDRYTAIRDIKMCGCPADFVHGLALPLAPITGVEDPLRPDGIWQFAWEEAKKRINAESIALVVNPQSRRSQNQLHVHLLRLNTDARTRLLEKLAGYVYDLEQVWTVASSEASIRGLKDYGILVAQSSPTSYMVVVIEESPELEFTKWRCD